MLSPSRCFPFACAIFCVLWFLLPVVFASPEPVTFVFKLPADQGDPFVRDIWVDVVTPSRKILRLPAFFLGNGQFAVRARAEEVGEYRLGKVTEVNQG